MPPLKLPYNPSELAINKKWTDQSLITTRSVDNYLAESDAFQRASFANLIEKWKELEKSKNERLISSFDAHYNMKQRFRQDDQLNRSSEMKYASVATYYRLIGSENNPKNTKPCGRHKRRTQDFEERHVKELLQLPPIIKPRRPAYFFGKESQLSPRDPGVPSSTEITSSSFLIDQSRSSFL